MDLNNSAVQLKWNDFQTNLPLSLKYARDSQEFCDVTLVCDDDTVLKAHRIILIAGSQFFEKILRGSTTVSHSHPLLYLRGVHRDELTAMLDFLYTGEASIQQENINSFLALSHQMGIKGLIAETDYHNFGPEQKEEEKFLTDTTLDHQIKSESPTNIQLPKVKPNEALKDTTNLKITVDALQKKILKQEALDRSSWILQNVTTFPKLPMTLKKLMSHSNYFRPYSISVLKWFLKPLHLKPGRNSFAGWEFLVSPADFVFSKGLLKGLGEGDFSLADIIDWSTFDNYGRTEERKKHNFSQGANEDLKKTSGVKCWQWFIKIFVEWAFVVVDIQPENWVLGDSSQ